jgi:hypothetical protein
MYVIDRCLPRALPSTPHPTNHVRIKCTCFINRLLTRMTDRSVLLTEFGDVRCRSMRTESFEYHIRIQYECYTNCLTMLAVHRFGCDILCHKKLCCKTSRSVSTHSGFDYHPPTHQLSSYQIHVLINVCLINIRLATVRSVLLTDFGDVR